MTRQQAILECLQIINKVDDDIEKSRVVMALYAAYDPDPGGGDPVPVPQPKPLRSA